MAKFLIKTTFILKARNYFVVGGDIFDGTISKGMTYHSNSNDFVSSVNSIEFLEGVRNDNLWPMVGLTFRCDERMTIEKFKSIFLTGETIEFV